MLKEFFQKMGRYAEQRPYWIESGVMFGDEWAPLLAAEVQRRLNVPKVVFAPLLDEQQRWEGWIRIKALADPNTPDSCQFIIDRPILPGHSAHFGNIEQAQESVLAQALFELGGVDEVVFHESIVIVNRDPAIDETWRTMGREIGEHIRAHLHSGLDTVSQRFLQRMPSEDEIMDGVMKVIREEINPVRSGHAGHVNLERIKNNTIWINMGGTCQDCEQTRFTARHGIGETIRHAVPAVGAIYDATDHRAGVNVYFLTHADMEGHDHEEA